MALRKTSFDFHSEESSLICIGQKGETYGTFITFGQREREGYYWGLLEVY